MKKLTVLIAVALSLALFAPAALAQAGINEWAATYPKAGANKGEILVKGIAAPSQGYTLQATGSIIVWPFMGGKQLPPASVDVDTKTGEWHIKNGVWSAQVYGGLTSGASYWVVVQCIAKKGANSEILTTPAASITAP